MSRTSVAISSGTPSASEGCASSRGSLSDRFTGIRCNSSSGSGSESALETAKPANQRIPSPPERAGLSRLTCGSPKTDHLKPPKSGELRGGQSRFSRTERVKIAQPGVPNERILRVGVAQGEVRSTADETPGKTDTRHLPPRGDDCDTPAFPSRRPWMSAQGQPESTSNPCAGVTLTYRMPN